MPNLLTGKVSTLKQQAAIPLLLAALAFSQGLLAIEPIMDIPYAEGPDGPLTLDLYLPENSDPHLVIWVHGGAWQFGSKEEPLALPIVDRGYALASIDFTPATEETPFPAMLHDIKAAIRFLRASGDLYGYQSENIAIWGHSSGGHLAALAGTTNDVPEFDGDLGIFTTQSSEVQAVIDMSGPGNLTSILAQSTPAGLKVREPALRVLLGGEMTDPGVAALARDASPVLQASVGDPPLLIMHGLQDYQVPVNQSLELQSAYIQRGLQVAAFWLPEGEHESPDFFEGDALDLVVDFLQTTLD